MSIGNNILSIKKELPQDVVLVAVSKFKPVEDLMEAYEVGQRDFGENRPQEMKQKAQTMPKDIRWHFIGHLQSNKIKMVVPYAYLIHSVDNEKLLFEIENYCRRNDYNVEALLEVHIASEDTKQGFSREEVLEMLDRMEVAYKEGNQDLILQRIKLRGLMAMASFTDDMDLVRKEFGVLDSIHKEILSRHYSFIDKFDIKSFGMTNDYHVALECGSTMIRVGTKIFGARDYSK